jgi:prepilin peptidase CpaA
MDLTVIIDISLNVLIIGVAIVGAITDVTKRKIYNWLTYPALAAGFLLQFVAHGWGSVFGLGLVSSILGAGFCTVVFGAFCVWGKGFGAGDVKLMAALGALAGFVHSMNVAMATALIGAVMALGRIAFGKGGIVAVKRLFKRNKEDKKEPITVPYGIAIALGAIWATLIRFNILKIF